VYKYIGSFAYVSLLWFLDVFRVPGQPMYVVEDGDIPCTKQVCAIAAAPV
jgi:hypothetical protein